MIKTLIRNEKKDLKYINNVLRDNNDFVKEKPHANILIITGTQSNENGNIYLDLFGKSAFKSADPGQFKTDCEKLRDKESYISIKEGFEDNRNVLVIDIDKYWR